MLESYLEKELARKLHIIDALWENEELTSIDLSLEVKASTATIKSDIKTLNQHYAPDNDPLIISGLFGYSILDKSKKEKRTYTKSLYNDSLFIRACCFNLMHNFEQTEKFASEEFISVSKAYELRKNVIHYLNELGISNTNLSATDNECRIRFLMTFFQLKLGIDFITIPAFNQFNFDELFQQFEASENCLLSEYSKEYASLLFQLGFERRKYDFLTFDSEVSESLTKTAVYQRFSPIVQQFLTKEFHVGITNEEVLYYSLVLNIMNANYYDNDRIPEILTTYVTLIKNSKILQYQALIDRFQTEFGEPFIQHPLFEAALITFLRKNIFNLQSLIPEEHIELGYVVKVPNQLLQQVTKIITDWNHDARLQLLFSKDHLKYLTSRFFFILNKKERVKHVYLLTSFYTDYLLGKEILLEEYGALVTVSQFDPKKSSADYSKTDLILHDSSYPILEKIGCSKLKISYIFDLNELQKIREHLFKYELEGLKKEE